MGLCSESKLKLPVVEGSYRQITGSYSGVNSSEPIMHEIHRQCDGKYKDDCPTCFMGVV